MGPTAPNPGPMFPIQEATALHAVEKSFVDKEIIKLPKPNINIYMMKKAMILSIVWAGTPFLLSFTLMTALGWMIRWSSLSEFLNSNFYTSGRRTGTSSYEKQHENNTFVDGRP